MAGDRGLGIYPNPLRHDYLRPEQLRHMHIRPDKVFTHPVPTRDSLNRGPPKPVDASVRTFRTNPLNFPRNTKGGPAQATGQAPLAQRIYASSPFRSLTGSGGADRPVLSPYEARLTVLKIWTEMHAAGIKIFGASKVN